jgi:hypothetical protein
MSSTSRSYYDSTPTLSGIRSDTTSTPVEGHEPTGLAGTINRLLHPALLLFGCFLFFISVIWLWTAMLDLMCSPPPCWKCLDINACLLLPSPGHPCSLWSCAICMGCQSKFCVRYPIRVLPQQTSWAYVMASPSLLRQNTYSRVLAWPCYIFLTAWVSSYSKTLMMQTE